MNTEFKMNRRKSQIHKVNTVRGIGATPTRASPAFLDEGLEVAASSHGQHWTPDTGQPSTPVDISRLKHHCEQRFTSSC